MTNVGLNQSREFVDGWVSQVGDILASASKDITYKVAHPDNEYMTQLIVRFQCPCGEVSRIGRSFSYAPAQVPPEVLASNILDALRAHFISEGNTPTF
jgi:hypothetical protein